MQKQIGYNPHTVGKDWTSTSGQAPSDPDSQNPMPHDAVCFVHTACHHDCYGNFCFAKVCRLCLRPTLGAHHPHRQQNHWPHCPPYCEERLAQGNGSGSETRSGCGTGDWAKHPRTHHQPTLRGCGCGTASEGSSPCSAHTPAPSSPPSGQGVPCRIAEAGAHHPHTWPRRTC